MWTVFLWFYALLLCLNGMVIYVDSVVDTAIISPFDLDSNVTATTQPNIAGVGAINANGTLVSNVTNNVVNGTDPSVLDPIQDFFFFPYALITTIIDFLTGAFVWNALAIVGMPTQFVIVLKSVIGFFAVLTAIHIWKYGI